MILLILAAFGMMCLLLERERRILAFCMGVIFGPFALVYYVIKSNKEYKS